MAEITWIKLSVDIFNDEKIRLIRSMPDSDMIFNVWIFLLTLAGKKNDSGLIYLERKIPYTPEMIGTLMGKTSDQIRFALQILSNFQMVEIFEDGLMRLVNWEKHQNIDGLDKVKEQTRLRVQRFREKERLAIQEFNSVSSNENERYSNVTVTQQNKNKNKKKEEIKEEIKEEVRREKRERFSPPDQLTLSNFFMQEKELSKVDADYRATRFLEFYESKGWMVGKNKMTNWKTAATRSLEWEDKRQHNTVTGNGKFGYNQIDENYVLNKVANS